jgi:Predicted AAA-ATPase
MRLPVGYDNFSKIVDEKLDFVDKTLLIRDVLDDVSEVIVITRPRRFGKTLNLSMLQYFFAAEAYGRKTQGLFDGLKITALGEEYMQHQGKYPVIFITLKDVKNHSAEVAVEHLAELIRQNSGPPGPAACAPRRARSCARRGPRFSVTRRSNYLKRELLLKQYLTGCLFLKQQNRHCNKSLIEVMHKHCIAKAYKKFCRWVLPFTVKP